MNKLAPRNLQHMQILFLFLKKKKPMGQGLSIFSPLGCCPEGQSQHYRFAFFTGFSSTFCWPLVRAPGGLTSLLRLTEGESCAFDLPNGGDLLTFSLVDNFSFANFWRFLGETVSGMPSLDVARVDGLL